VSPRPLKSRLKRPRRSFYFVDRQAELLLASPPPGIGHNRPPPERDGAPPRPLKDDDLLTPYEVAAWVRMSYQWLQIGRCRGWGPEPTKFGRSVLYKVGDVRAWLRQRARVYAAKQRAHRAARDAHNAQRRKNWAAKRKREAEATA
jgi:hypothetical protein